MADSFLPGNISGSISDSDNDMLEVKDHVNQVEDHVDHVNHVDQVAAKVWGEELSEAEEKHEFNERGARPRPKLTVENENENGQLTTVKPSQAYEAVKVEGSIVRMKWSNDINWELKKNKDIKRRQIPRCKYLDANTSMQMTVTLFKIITWNSTQIRVTTRKFHVICCSSMHPELPSRSLLLLSTSILKT